MLDKERGPYTLWNHSLSNGKKLKIKYFSHVSDTVGL